ncbi:hypothetical protein C1H76_0615 [Elsinoe australis]|uniref:Uncharacterized protein n=1 Tax=Elsinoe australis TaxID=40998 RepID=A0A4U7B6M6_9PEZI|nr:hypothetical protein C1H76_0615 [Elsinoe australis]
MASTLTTREMELWGIAMRCNKAEVQIDWDQFCALSGLGRASAATTWSNIKRKIREEGPGGNTAKAKKGRKPTQSAKQTTTSSKKGKRANNNENDEEDQIDTAAKKRTKVKQEPKVEGDGVADRLTVAGGGSVDMRVTGAGSPEMGEGASEFGQGDGSSPTLGLPFESLYGDPSDLRDLGFASDDTTPAADFGYLG